jgi:AcrR family transcriptional regulator
LREDARRNRLAVIDGAIDLLARNPDASMQEIADASGLGRTTVYRHFPTRDDLFAALLDRALAQSWEVANEVFARDLPFEATVRELCAALVDAGVGYRFLLSYGNPPALETSRTAAENPIMGWFRAAKDRGEIRADLPLHWVMSCFQALALVAMQDYAAGRQGRERTAELLSESVLALLRDSAEIVPAEDSQGGGPT